MLRERTRSCTHSAACADCGACCRTSSPSAPSPALTPRRPAPSPSAAKPAFWRRSFLYQPLDLRTSVVLEDDELLDELRFPAGTPVDLRYGFTYWRATYLYDLAGGPDHELALGAGLQLRNATITFTSADGALRRAERDVGPVPLLVLRGRLPLSSTAYVGGEAAGLYAPVRYLNGGDSEVDGAILDAAVQLGLAWRAGLEGFVTVRYLGGGARGTSRDDDDVGDGFASNWLHFVIIGVGANLR